MAGKIKKIIDMIMQERSSGNPAIAEMMKAKLILKGINPDHYDSTSEDNSIVIKKLLAITRQLDNVKSFSDRTNIKSVFSAKSFEEEIVSDIKEQLDGFRAKLIIFFASSCFDHENLSFLMHETFKDSIVFGCSTAGEIVNGNLLKKSVVAMAFNSNIISDAKIEVIDLANMDSSLDTSFMAYKTYFNEDPYTMDATRYAGLVLIDGLSMKEEKIMDLIGNKTNVLFVGGSAGDDRKYIKTFICANGKVYNNSAILTLLKLNENAEFGIIKTQSLKVLNHVLVANKVNEETREVIEFNNQPAIKAYAEAVGAAAVDDAPKYFTTNPVGLIVGENELFVRSPRQISGTNIKFFCGLLEGMEVHLLESTDIIEDTRNAIAKKLRELGRIDGIINFQCVIRTKELEEKNMVKEYAELFSDIPMIGFSSYGEQYIGHMNQTSTMLVFKNNPVKLSNFREEVNHTGEPETQNYLQVMNEKLEKENLYLHRLILEKHQQLEETTAALKEFNILLENEINERTKREEEINYLSYHDKLTGLYNRRFYEEERKKLDNKRNLPLSIIMGDVNGLKKVNDTLGHEKGDELIVKAANSIQSACRADDMAARWGGDEFIILLPKTENEQVKGIIKRINDQLSGETVGNMQVSVSFGWDTKNNPDQSIDEVLKNAEDYMYQQKIIECGDLRGSISNAINDALFEENPNEQQHSRRVGELCQKIGRAMGLSELEARKLRAVGILHDIGKIAIADSIINKPGTLSEQEWEQIKLHTEIGYAICTSSFNMLELANGILLHHERWDGKGYPRHLKGEEIPISARIVALADSYDAMISEQVYRKALHEEEVLSEIRENAGKQFDPGITRIFIERVLGKSMETE